VRWPPIERHPQYRVAGLEEGKVRGRVGRRARVRLHVDVLGAENLLCPVDGKVLHHIDVLAPTVVALSRIPLGVFVRERRPQRGEHRR